MMVVSGAIAARCDVLLVTYRSELDTHARVFGCRFSNGGDSARDYVEHFARLEELTALRRAGTKQLALLVVFDPGYPLPNAGNRKRAAQVTAAPHFDHFVAIVSASPLVRGVLTAINWLRPQQHVNEVFTSPWEAIGWLEEKRGERLNTLREIEARLSAVR